MAKKTSKTHSGTRALKKSAKAGKNLSTAAARKAVSTKSPAKKKAAKKKVTKKASTRLAAQPPAAPPNILIVNMVPNSLSGEANQDAEPNLTVNRTNPQKIVATAFTPNPAGGDRAPYYISLDGGNSWTLNSVLPSGVAQFEGQMFGSETGDITAAFSGSGDRLYASILQDTTNINDHPMDFLTTLNFAGSALMTRIGGREGADQPYAEAATASSGPNAGKDVLFIGSNASPTGNQDSQTSTIDFTLNAAAPRPKFTTVTIESRNTGSANQDGPQVRPVYHSDGTVYAAFTGWRASTGDFQGNTLVVTSDIVVVRDDKQASGSAPFTDLVDPGDNKSGLRVVQNIQFPFHSSGDGVPGQNRFGGDVSIAVDPRDSSVVYLAYGEGPDVEHYNLHVVMSRDKGQTWSADLLTVVSATNPSLAVNSGGKLGFLYQQLTGTDPVFRWETHFQRTVDGVTWVDLVLATVPADNPPKQGDPYLGDYDRVTAVGADFYGVFSTSNIPDMRNFPNGVVYQRNADFRANKLLDVNGASEVQVSIDPFFFKVTES
jgi:hypothetical protein